MKSFTSRALVLGIATAVGLTSAVQAAPLNIWSASRSQEASNPQMEQVQRRHGRHRYHGRHHRHRGINPGAAAAIGIGGLAVGAAIAGSQNRYYDDRYYDDGYYDEGPAYRGRVIRECPDRPVNYPTDGC